MIALSSGAWFLAGLGKQQEGMAARESRKAALQGVTGPGQVEEALRQHPQNKLLQVIAMANKAANETAAAIEKLSNEVEPPSMAKGVNLAAASRSDLEALRGDLRTAEANAAALMPRTGALLQTERDTLEKSARSLNVDKDTIGRFMDRIDQRHAEIAAFTSRLSSARVEYYRAYQSYVAVLAGAFGSYKVEGGQFIFPFQRTVDNYNVAAHAMTVAAKRITELEGERKSLLKSQQEGWEPFISGK